MDLSRLWDLQHFPILHGWQVYKQKEGKEILLSLSLSSFTDSLTHTLHGHTMNATHYCEIAVLTEIKRSVRNVIWIVIEVKNILQKCLIKNSLKKKDCHTLIGFRYKFYQLDRNKELHLKL